MSSAEKFTQHAEYSAAVKAVWQMLQLLNTTDRRLKKVTESPAVFNVNMYISCLFSLLISTFTAT